VPEVVNAERCREGGDGLKERHPALYDQQQADDKEQVIDPLQNVMEAQGDVFASRRVPEMFAAQPRARSGWPDDRRHCGAVETVQSHEDIRFQFERPGLRFVGGGGMRPSADGKRHIQQRKRQASRLGCAPPRTAAAPLLPVDSGVRVEEYASGKAISLRPQGFSLDMDGATYRI